MYRTFGGRFIKSLKNSRRQTRLYLILLCMLNPSITASISISFCHSRTLSFPTGCDQPIVLTRYPQKHWRYFVGGAETLRDLSLHCGICSAAAQLLEPCIACHKSCAVSCSCRIYFCILLSRLLLVCTPCSIITELWCLWRHSRS